MATLTQCPGFTVARKVAKRERPVEQEEIVVDEVEEDVEDSSVYDLRVCDLLAFTPPKYSQCEDDVGEDSSELLAPWNKQQPPNAHWYNMKDGMSRQRDTEFQYFMDVGIRRIIYKMDASWSMRHDIRYPKFVYTIQRLFNANGKKQAEGRVYQLVRDTFLGAVAADNKDFIGCFGKYVCSRKLQIRSFVQIDDDCQKAMAAVAATIMRLVLQVLLLLLLLCPVAALETERQTPTTHKVWKWNPEADHPCTIPRWTVDQVVVSFGPLGIPPLHPWPLIVRASDGSRNAVIRRLVQTPPSLLHQFDEDFLVTLSSSNSFSDHRRTVAFQQYLDEIGALNHTGVTLPTALANESWYLFGETYSDVWKQRLLRHYTLPPCQTCRASYVALSFGVGNRGSGVQWHTHGPGFSESLVGRKHWVLYPPRHNPPAYHPDQTSRHWMEYVYSNTTLLRQPLEMNHNNTGESDNSINGSGPNAPIHGRPYECTLEPGDLVYFPDRWHHATINCDPYTVFVSTFTADHLYIKDQHDMQEMEQQYDKKQQQAQNVEKLWTAKTTSTTTTTTTSTRTDGREEL